MVTLSKALLQEHFNTLLENISSAYEDKNNILVPHNYYISFYKNNFGFIQRTTQYPEIKERALQLYINTMINIYSKPDYVKKNMFVVFGCSFYKDDSRYYRMYQPHSETDLKIKRGIVYQIIGAKSILLLSLINKIEKNNSMSITNHY